MEADLHALLLVAVAIATVFLCVRFGDARAPGSRVMSALAGGGVFFLLTLGVGFVWT